MNKSIKNIITNENFKQSALFVSVIIIARNANRYIKKCLDSLFETTYPLERIEFILIDSMSSDGTKEEFYKFKSNNPNKNILILDNPGKILASGWNIALEHAIGDVLIRLDAHSQVDREYISKCVSGIVKGESIVGGKRISIPSNNTFKSTLLHMAETSIVGAGIAYYRRGIKSSYVDTLAHAAYHKRVFAAVGGYDERLIRTEDNEIHYRMKKAGFKFYFDPQIISLHNTRDSLIGILKQKYLNGYWVGLTMGVSPACFSLRHFVPAIFVCSLCVISTIGLSSSFVPLLLFMSSYILSIFFLTLFLNYREAKKFRLSINILIIPLFFLIHLVYGVGTIISIFTLPVYIWKWRKRKEWIPNIPL